MAKGSGGVSVSYSGLSGRRSGKIPSSGSISSALGLRNSSEARSVFNALNTRINNSTGAQRQQLLNARRRLSAEWGGSYFGF